MRAASASAAKTPLRTAPSMVEGQPVSVHSPARKRLDIGVAWGGRCFDAPGIEVLEQFGVDRALATSYTLVLHAALLLPITLLGFYYMGRESVSWEDFGIAAKIKKERSTS